MMYTDLYTESLRLKIEQNYVLKDQDRSDRGSDHQDHKDFCLTRSHTISVP